MRDETYQHNPTPRLAPARRSPAWDPHQQGWKQATIRAQLPRRLARDAKAFGFRGELWTTAQAAAVTERASGVHDHPAHVSRLLRASAARCAQRWPGVKKAQVGGGSIVWVDQSGFYLLLGVVPTYAPCGHTPVLRLPLTRDPLSVMSGITMTGELLLRVPERAYRCPDVAHFLKHVLRHLPGKLLVI